MELMPGQRSRRILFTASALFLFLFLPGALSAQAVNEPRLHHRGDPDPTNRPILVKPGRGSGLIPEEASGEYLLGKPGDVIEITLQFGELSGYISRQGDGESDNGAQLTFFFDQAAVRGRTLTFTTRQVHGVSYSFQGTIERGTGLSPAEDGYYMLAGELVRHDAVSRTDAPSRVSLKSGRQTG